MNNINLSGEYTQQVNVSVTKEELFKKVKDSFSEKDLYLLTKIKLYKKMGLPQGAFISNGKWFLTQENYTSHCFEYDELVREVSESDKTYLKLLDQMKEVLDVE